ncbi:DUF1561 family protein [Piscirickettsia salmonis]|nr:DUF1561 family protein [Piscirickettsia salmonis]
MIMYPPELTPAEPTTVAYYDHSPSYEPSASIWDGIDPEFITPDLLYIDSCASIGAYLPPPMRKRSINKVSDEMVHKALPPVAPGCDYTDNAVRKKNLKNLPTIQSQLKAGGYCLAPTQAKTSNLLSASSYLYAQTCSNVEQQKAIYDSLGRIVFPKDAFGIPVCMTAPGNVVKGDDSWDYVKFWPCDIYNSYQRWIFKKGKIVPRLNQKLSIQWYGNYGIISKSGSNDIALETKNMTKNFFFTPSKISTYWYEIGMRFYDKDDKTYYPTYHNVYSYGNDYSDKTYYDLENRRILMLSFYGRAFQTDGWQLSCLTSSIAGTTANEGWTYFQPCQPFMSNVPNNLRWYFKNRVNDPVSSMQIYNADKTPLYVSYDSFGYLFESKSAQGTGKASSFFDLPRRYGICANSKGWYQCSDFTYDKHEKHEL